MESENPRGMGGGGPPSLFSLFQGQFETKFGNVQVCHKFYPKP